MEDKDSRRDVPVLYAVVVTKQGLIERFHRRGIAEVNRVRARRALANKGLQRWRAGRQGRKVVAIAMTMARVEEALGRRCGHARLFLPRRSAVRAEYFSLR